MKELSKDCNWNHSQDRLWQGFPAASRDREHSVRWMWWRPCTSNQVPHVIAHSLHLDASTDWDQRDPGERKGDGGQHRLWAGRNHLQGKAAFCRQVRSNSRRWWFWKGKLKWISRQLTKKQFGGIFLGQEADHSSYREMSWGVGPVWKGRLFRTLWLNITRWVGGWLIG